MRNIDLFDEYLSGRLSTEEKIRFEQDLETNKELRNEFDKHKNFVETLRYASQKNNLKNKLKSIHTEEFGASNIQHISKSKTIYQKYIRPTGFAASIAVIAVILTITTLSTGGYLIKKQNSEVQKLSNEVDVLKIKQDALINGLKKGSTKKKVYAPANTTGTGFALNNKGYFITCLHVVKGSDSLFIGNKLLDRASARVVYTDTKLDIAILKIDSVSMLKWKDLPYTFKAVESDLAEKTFTLGYPAQDIVYGEGSISSSSALGDTAMYQISIPVNKGNSGGPLIDENGNIAGVVNGKKTNAEGTGFATKSTRITDVIKNIEDEDLKKELSINKRNSLKGLKRSEQVKRITPYVINVFVYKNN